MQNTARTEVACVDSHLAPIVGQLLEANFSIRNIYIDYRGEEGHIFASLSDVVRGDKELVFAQKHSMRIFVLGVLAGIKIRPEIIPSKSVAESCTV